MNIIAWLMLLAGILPLLGAVTAKIGGKQFDNNAPREWLERQEGWRARANAAHVNLFEGLPLFYAAVLFALYAQVEVGWLATLMVAWLVARVLYVGAYIANVGTLRSVVWGIALLINIVILFTGV
jgi:uncharacterized MAPEG superfamily protein